MKIELKNVQYAAFASEETNCFDATIYVDGKRAGSARNDGHGGCTWVEPRELQQRLDEYGATLPRTSLGESFGDMQQDAESLIDDLLETWLQRRDMKRAMSGRILYVGADAKLRTTNKPKQAATLAFWLKDAEARRGIFAGALAVLNTLPEDAALACYLKYGSAAP